MSAYYCTFIHYCNAPDTIPLHTVIIINRLKFLFYINIHCFIVSGSINIGDFTLGLLQSERKSDIYIHHCKVCGRGYRHKENLTRHKRVECGKEAQFYCMYCHYKSKHKHDLLRHLKCRHPVAALRY
jgi:hypothetical protein